MTTYNENLKNLSTADLYAFYNFIPEINLDELTNGDFLALDLKDLRNNILVELKMRTFELLDKK